MVIRNNISIPDGRASISSSSPCVASANHAPLPIIAIMVPKAAPILAILRNSSGNRAATIDAPPINVSKGAFMPLPTGIRSVAHAAATKYSSAPVRSQSRILLDVIRIHHIHTSITIHPCQFSSNHGITSSANNCIERITLSCGMPPIAKLQPKYSTPCARNSAIFAAHWSGVPMKARLSLI